MFTPVELQYMGDVARQGGRASIEKTVPVDVFWDESIRNSGNERYLNVGADIKATFLFADPVSVTKIIPGRVYVKKGDELYKVVDSIPVIDGLGLEATYDLLLKRVREYGS